MKAFLRTSCAFSILVQFSKIRSCKPGCAPANHAHTYARIRRDISAAWFCSCKLLWGSDECVLLPRFNAQPNIFVWTAVS